MSILDLKDKTVNGLPISGSRMNQVSHPIRQFLNPNWITDPTSVGFRIFFHYGDSEGLLADKEHINSAEAYLSRIGDIGRLELLRTFKKHLQNINIVFPFLFKSIDGLDELQQLLPGKLPEEGNQINIRTLETIDWKIQGLINLYRKVVYDYDRGVEILPQNLRRFTLSIYIYDNVILTEPSTFIDEANNTSDGTQASIGLSQIAPTRETVNDLTKVKRIMFDLWGCEFDPFNSCSDFISSVSNEEMKEATNNISIKYARSSISSFFEFLSGSSVVSDLNINFNNISIAQGNKLSSEKFNFKQTLKDLAAPAIKYAENFSIDKIQSAVKSAGVNLQSYAESRIRSAIAARMNSVFLGNVYELDARDISNFINSTQYHDQIQSISQLIKNGTKTMQDFGRENNPRAGLKSMRQPPPNVYQKYQGL